MAGVSVVVPTRNRAGRLRLTLDALARQQRAPEFEVIVVDDGSTDETPAVLEAAAADFPHALTTLHPDARRGPGAARNRGWRAATGDRICFTDDDCEPAPTWVAQLCTALDGADVAQGVTLPNPTERGRWGPFSHTVEITAERGFYETCNIAYRRRWLEVLGGFDEAYGYYCEDTDLAWRALGSGARTAFVADAVVYHAIGASDFAAHVRGLRRRTGLVRLVRLHPAARSLLVGRCWHKATHPPAVACAAAISAVAISRRSPSARIAAGGALAWYTVVCVRTWKAPARTRQWLSVVPLALLADLAEVGVLLAASAGERTLVL